MAQRGVPPPPNFDDEGHVEDDREDMKTCKFRNTIKYPINSKTLTNGIQKRRRTHRFDNSSALDIAHAEARRVGGKIPGDDPEEVERWIKERLRNWPSKANVARKLEEEKKMKKRGALFVGESGGELRMLAEVYGSSSSSGEEENEGEGGKGRKYGRNRRGWRNSQQRDRGGKGKGVYRGRKDYGDRRYGRWKRRNLLRVLLDKEIREEQNIVLQCFRLLVNTEFLTSEKEEDYCIP